MSEASSWNAPQAPVANYTPSPRPEPVQVSEPAPPDPKQGKTILIVRDATPSPEQQDKPSSEDLDAVAAEEKAKADTTAAE